jgi:predicted DNA binding CopG/RHH family protein
MKKVPEFKNEDEEFEFWSTADSTEYVDWSRDLRVKFVKLKPTLRTISVRLPVAMVEDLKILANQRHVPYQSLLKVFLAERLQREKTRRLAV